MQDYRKLTVWRQSMDLAEACYDLTDDFPRREQYGLASQLRRSAVSIPSNIAEGCGRGTPRDFARFLRIAYASSCEVSTQIELAQRTKIGDADKLANAAVATEDIRRMIPALIAKLKTENCRGVLPARGTLSIPLARYGSRFVVSRAPRYVPSSREQAFLDTVENPKYDRQIINGLSAFFEDRAPDDMKGFYSGDEIAELMALRGTDRDVEDRMPVKITRHFFDLAKNSEPLQRLVKASPDETLNLQGSEDPGFQMDYSPVEGLLHKYEMGLMYVISTCSAHCRFCYREELIGRKEVERQDGTVAKKGLAQIREITDYVRVHNAHVADNGGHHPDTGREKLREVLLSGGDAMALPNSKIAAWLAALAEAGVESIRLGTKEMAFYPDRFDDTFLSMLDRFHEVYPDVGFRLMIHFNHPDEFLRKGPDGEYIENPNGSLEWVPSTKRAMDAVVSRGWIQVENQAPIIKGINDDADALRIMQRSLYRVGVGNHYFFCGRDIVAYRAFNVPIETAWNILNESQKGLSGAEAHARLSITHYKGKTEVAAVTSEPIPGLAGAENGVLIFKILRSAADAPDRGKVCIVGRNPEAIWFDDYEDRVIFDEAGLFDYSRVEKMSEPVPVTIGSVGGD